MAGKRLNQLWVLAETHKGLFLVLANSGGNKLSKVRRFASSCDGGGGGGGTQPFNTKRVNPTGEKTYNEASWVSFF